jgi:hypothetical protein
MKLGSERSVDLAASLNSFEELGTLSPYHEANSVFSIRVLVADPLTKHPISFSAATRTSKEHLEAWAGQ